MIGLAGLAARLLDGGPELSCKGEAIQDIRSIWGTEAAEQLLEYGNKQIDMRNYVNSMIPIGSIWPELNYDHPKMKHGYNHDCKSCFGFGLWPSDEYPLYETEARDGFESDPCPECGEDNSVYAQLHEEKEKEMAADSLPANVEIDKILYEFEKGLRCAELLVIQGQSE